MMKLLSGFRFIFVLICLIGTVSGASAVDFSASSANAYLPGCRSLAYKPTQATAQAAFEMGDCSGHLAGVIAMDFRVCPPDGATSPAQLARVVVQYIDSRPQRHHELFVSLAAEALEKAWPCDRDVVLQRLRAMEERAARN